MQNSKTLWLAAVTSAIILVSMAVIIPTGQLNQHSESGHGVQQFLARANQP